MEKNKKAKKIVGLVPKRNYRNIYDNVPIVCVDLLVVYKNEFLLCKRTSNPGKGDWYFPGGRIFKNEKIIDAIKRKAKEELGLKVSTAMIEQITTGETIFHNGPFGGNIHTVNVIYRIKLNKKPTMKKDHQHSEIRWFTGDEQAFNPYIKEVLGDSSDDNNCGPQVNLKE